MPAETPHVRLRYSVSASFPLLRCASRLLASHAEGFHLRVLLKPCVNLSIHTASDARLPTWSPFEGVSAYLKIRLGRWWWHRDSGNGINSATAPGKVAVSIVAHQKVIELSTRGPVYPWQLNDRRNAGNGRCVPASDIGCWDCGPAQCLKADIAGTIVQRDRRDGIIRFSSLWLVSCTRKSFGKTTASRRMV